MKVDDPDPVKRWRAIIDFYTEFSAVQHWEFLAPMVQLAVWLSDQPMAARLYPGTSHEWLCVSLVPGYNPDLPFFSCGTRGEGMFECELWKAVGRRWGKRLFPWEEATKAFAEFVKDLDAIAEQARSAGRA